MVSKIVNIILYPIVNSFWGFIIAGFFLGTGLLTPDILFAHFPIYLKTLIIGIGFIFLVWNIFADFFKKQIERYHRTFLVMSGQKVIFDFSNWYFGLGGFSNGDFIGSFQFAGENISNQIVQIKEAYIKSENTSVVYPILFQVKGVLYKPVNITGIPPHSNFVAAAPLDLEYKEGTSLENKMTIQEFQKNIGAFWMIVVFENSNTFKKYFSVKENNQLIQKWLKLRYPQVLDSIKLR